VTSKPKTLGDMVFEKLQEMGLTHIDCGPPIALKIEPLEVTMAVVQFAGGKPVPGPTLRTCWECNSAHEHLKKCAELVCIACGKRFAHGEEVQS